MDRNNLSIRQRTSIAQKLPENFEHKLQKFQSFIIADVEDTNTIFHWLEMQIRLP